MLPSLPLAVEGRNFTFMDAIHFIFVVWIDSLLLSLAVTVGAYEKLVDVVGADSTLVIFNRQVKTVREEENQSKRQK